MTLKILIGTLLCLMFMACGTNYGGNYTGTLAGTLGGQTVSSGAMTMTLYQNGSNVSGTFITTGTPTAAGTVTGSPSGGTLNSTTLTITSLNGSVANASSLTGTLTLSGTNLTGPLTGTTNGSASNVTLNLNQSN